MTKNDILIEDHLAQEVAKWEAEKPTRDKFAAKKKKAADELIALGISKESAYLIANYFEEESPEKVKPRTPRKADTKEVTHGLLPEGQ